MRDEYNFDELNSRKNPYAAQLKKQQEECKRKRSTSRKNAENKADNKNFDKIGRNLQKIA